MRTLDLISLAVFFFALLGSLVHMWRALRPKCRQCGWRLTTAVRPGSVEGAVKSWLSITFPFRSLLEHHLHCERCARRG